MKAALYFDQTRCIGCYTCYVACKEWHDIPAGSAEWLRIEEIERGRYPDVFVAFMVRPCYHCENPTCAAVCPPGCIEKRARDGVVVVDSERCVGKAACGQCLEACPYGAPQFGPEPDARMEKCDLCSDRLEEGRQPTCVSSCPVRALGFGDLEELRRRHGLPGSPEGAPGFVYHEENRPAVVIRGKTPQAAPRSAPGAR